MTKHTSFVLVALLGALALLFVAPLCYGQAVAVAEIHGQVLDPSGAAIVGATIRVTQTDTQYTRTITSDATGGYIFANLPLGPYRLEVTSQGFKTNVQSGILLQVGNNVQINANLQVGAVSESIEVQSQAAMVETKDNAVAQVIDERRILELPLNHERERP